MSATPNQKSVAMMPAPKTMCAFCRFDRWGLKPVRARFGALLCTVAVLAGSALVQPSFAQTFGGADQAEDRGDADPRNASPNNTDQGTSDRPTVVRPTGGLRGSLGDDDEAADQRYRSGTAISAEDRAVLERFGAANDALIIGTIDQPTLTGTQASAPDQTDPYAALGVRAGPLTWFPAIDLAIGYDSNPDSASSGARDVYTLRLSPEVRVVSDWRRHQWNASARGTFEFFDDGRDIGAQLDAATDLQLDLAHGITAALEGGYTLSGEAQSDPNATTDAVGTTLTQELRGGIGLARRFGLVEASVGVDLTRSIFDDSDLADGTAQSNDDRNRYDLTGTLRFERAEGPLIRPFVEGSITLRQFDDGLDRNGFARNSLGYGLRGGVIMGGDGPLRGSLAVGLIGEELDDARLGSIDTIDVQAGLTWDVSELTAVTLDIGTGIDPTTQAGSGVGVTRSAALGLTHAIRRNIDLRLGAEVSDTDFTGTGTDTRTYTGRAGLTWQLSRVAAFRVDGTYEHQPSSGDDDTDRMTLEAGITLRR